MFIVINSKTGRPQHSGAYLNRGYALMKLLELERVDMEYYGTPPQSYEIVEVESDE